MHNHAPVDYACPFCGIIQNWAASRVSGAASQASGAASGTSRAASQANRAASQVSGATDVIYQAGGVTAFVSLGRWARNPVDVLVIPDAHFENLYDLPDRLALPLHRLSRAVALALKAVYQCEGVSLRQHNEPAGSQDVWHYHIHVTPRFNGDGFYQASRVPFPEAERLEEARKLRAYMEKNADTLCRDQVE